MSIRRKACRRKSDGDKPQSPRSKPANVTNRKPQTTLAANNKRAAPAAEQTDLREQLANGGLIGPVEKVSLAKDVITSVRGILLDLDVTRFRRSMLPPGATLQPTPVYKTVVQPMLERNCILSRAEVRRSGTGLHAIVWLEQPVKFEDEASRDMWAAIVRIVQRLLPSDPDAPGITALTRPIASINSKNGSPVKVLKHGEPVNSDEIIQLVQLVRRAPFQTIMPILLGGARISPCPICRKNGSTLAALDRVGKCYGSCGTVELGHLYDLFLKPRANKQRG